MDRIIHFFNKKRYVHGAETTAPCTLPITLVKTLIKSAVATQHFGTGFVFEVPIMTAIQKSKGMVIHQLIVKFYLLDADAIMFHIDTSEEQNFGTQIIFQAKRKVGQEPKSFRYKIQ